MNAVKASRTFNRPILVHETASHWTAEMERAFTLFPEATFRWRPYREELLEEVPQASLVLLVVAADDASLELIRQLRKLKEAVPIACLIPQSRPDWEWLARELGADLVLPDTTEIDRVAYSLQRRLGMTSTVHR